MTPILILGEYAESKLRYTEEQLVLRGAKAGGMEL